jgi:hypothetical protein
LLRLRVLPGRILLGWLLLTRGHLTGESLLGWLLLTRGHLTGQSLLGRLLLTRGHLTRQSLLGWLLLTRGHLAGRSLLGWFLLTRGHLVGRSLLCILRILRLVLLWWRSLIVSRRRLLAGHRVSMLWIRRPRMLLLRLTLRRSTLFLLPQRSLVLSSI